MTIEVIEEAKIDVTCDGCRSKLRANHSDFIYQHTNPPIWKITCTVCNYVTKTSPSELIAAVVANMHSMDVAMMMDRQHDKMYGGQSTNFMGRQIERDLNPQALAFDCYGRPI